MHNIILNSAVKPVKIVTLFAPYTFRPHPQSIGLALVPVAGRFDIVKTSEEPAHVNDGVAVVIHDLVAVCLQLVVLGPRPRHLGQ